MNQAKFKIRQLAQQIINNQIDFIEGCRKVTQLSNYLNNSDIERLDKHLLVIKGISSESDRFPVGKVRATCSLKHLTELDIEKEKFIIFYSSTVSDSCQNIIDLI